MILWRVERACLGKIGRIPKFLGFSVDKRKLTGVNGIAVSPVCASESGLVISHIVGVAWKMAKTSLTKREQDCVVLRMVGKQAKEGAARLQISIHTYRAHLRHGMELIRITDPQTVGEFLALLKKNGIGSSISIIEHPARKKGK
jgi:DNA-binding CsgD family transcriptional regulator